MNRKTYVVLDNVRSAHNVGAIFRTCEGAGVSKIYLCGYTPTPIDRFGREVSEIKKTSLGASRMVPWIHIESIVDCCATLKKQGIEIVAVEQSSDSVAIFDYSPKVDTAFVFGNEVVGVDENVCKNADKIIHIKMKGRKESLNVATTVGVVLFQPWSQ
jgi:23S rRNA (guanosine2251-2'-O)-methyltransferase